MLFAKAWLLSDTLIINVICNLREILAFFVMYVCYVISIKRIHTFRVTCEFAELLWYCSYHGSL